MKNLLVIILLTLGLTCCKHTKYTLKTTSIPVCEEFYIDDISTHKHSLLSIEYVVIK